MTDAICDCGKPATCLGNYEGADEWSYACDSCCGHGCEDGECRLIADIPALVTSLSEWIDRYQEQVLTATVRAERLAGLLMEARTQLMIEHPASKTRDVLARIDAALSGEQQAGEYTPTEEEVEAVARDLYAARHDETLPEGPDEISRAWLAAGRVAIALGARPPR